VEAADLTVSVMRSRRPRTSRRECLRPLLRARLPLRPVLRRPLLRVPRPPLSLLLSPLFLPKRLSRISRRRERRLARTLNCSAAPR
jgi:hypothetical protein